MVPPPEPTEQERRDAFTLFALARAEDLGTQGDITSAACIPATRQATLRLVAQQRGVLAGLAFADTLLEAFDGSAVRIDYLRADGAALEPGSVVAELSGPARELLAVERTLLNMIARLSGIATLTRAYVEAVAGTGARVLDTRKTTPGWRRLEKYAVRAGGGQNHRFGLFDAVLVKDNHRRLWCSADQGRTLAELVETIRGRVAAGVTITVEVDTLEEFRDVLAAAPDIVLLDNMSVEELREAVALRDRHAPGVALEASGGITLASVRSIAETGVDRISIGALTHAAPWLDFSGELVSGRP